VFAESAGETKARVLKYMLAAAAAGGRDLEQLAKNGPPERECFRCVTESLSARVPSHAISHATLAL
jgi:hypothetical protein